MSLPNLFPYPLPFIWLQTIDFDLIWPNCPPPIPHGPLCPLWFFPLMCWEEFRPCLLHYSLYSCFFSTFWTVIDDRECVVIFWSDWVTWAALSALWEMIRHIAYLVSEEESLGGHPPSDLESVSLCFEWSLDMVLAPRPVMEEIWWVVSPLSRKERI